MRRHSTAAGILLFLCGALFTLLGMVVMGWARPWLPEWVMPVFIFAGGALLILLRFRRPVPQDEPEFHLFLGIVYLILGAVFLFPLLF